jgi:hypothetical protein
MKYLVSWTGFMAMLLMNCRAEYNVKEGVMLAESSSEVLEIEQSPISCKLNIITEQQIVDGVFIDFSLFNHSDDDLSVLSWYTPLEGFYSNLFIIKDQNGEALPYQGPMVKRANPLPADYVMIRANGSVATMLDLTLVYNLIPGDYKVQLNKKTLQVIENDMPMSIYHCPNDILSFSVI